MYALMVLGVGEILGGVLISKVIKWLDSMKKAVYA